MNHSLDPNSRLAELLSAACSEMLADEEREEFEALLVDNAEAQQIYLSYCRMHGALLLGGRAERSAQAAFEKIRSAESNQNQVESRRKKSSVLDVQVAVPVHRFSMETRHLAAGIAIAVGFVVMSLSAMHQILLPVRVVEEGQGIQPIFEAEIKPVESVARLVDEVDAKWQGYVVNPVFDRKQRIKSGMKLYRGQKLVLVSGIAEFKFFNGAEVVLKGPAEFEVQGRKQCRLEIGELVAKAHEERAKGFIVETPTTTVEDLGTEFGVLVDSRRRVKVSVFEGEVGFTDRQGEQHSLTDGKTATISPDAATFVTENNGDIAKQFVRSATRPRVSTGSAVEEIVISINFGTGPNTTMDPEEVAGILAKANWNNAIGSAGAARRGQLNDLVDANGESTAAQLRWQLGYFQYNSNLGPGNRKVMEAWGAMSTSPPESDEGGVRVSNLPDAFVEQGYDVYVYFDARSKLEERIADPRIVKYTIGDQVRFGRETRQDFNERFIKASGTSYKDAKPGNYVRFRGLNAREFVLTGDAKKMRAPINAIQIVTSAATGERK